MAQPETIRTIELVDAAHAGSSSTPFPAQARGDTAYFDDALQDAERLLKYSAEIGIDVDDSIRHDVLQARTFHDVGWSEQVASNLLTALAQLAAQLKPVTAESLKACNQERHTVRGYWIVAACLAATIVPFSLASFVATGLSDAIRKDIATANDLVVKISSQIQGPQVPTQAAQPAATTDAPEPGPLPATLLVEVETEFQQWASIVRELDRRSRQLNRFVPGIVSDRSVNTINHSPQDFQLPKDLSIHLLRTFGDELPLYQDVRNSANTVVDDVSLVYGAIANCLLPALYALLGTCAYLLRSFEEQMRTKTFVRSVANSTRFLIAGICGLAVGLFSNFTVSQVFTVSPGASVSPLAISFLVGYGVDVFFSFLDGLLQAFTKPRTGVNAPASTPSSSGRPR